MTMMTTPTLGDDRPRGNDDTISDRISFAELADGGKDSREQLLSVFSLTWRVRVPRMSSEELKLARGAAERGDVEPQPQFRGKKSKRREVVVPNDPKWRAETEGLVHRLVMMRAESWSLAKLAHAIGVAAEFETFVRSVR